MKISENSAGNTIGVQSGDAGAGIDNFEDRISRSAIRLRNERNGTLRVPANPLGYRRMAWGWVTTPAAAVIGVIFGICVPKSVEPSAETVARQADTIVKELIVRDTVYVSAMSAEDGAGVRTAEVRVPHKETAAETVSERQEKRTLACEDTGKCILDDGVDYSMLARF